MELNVHSVMSPCERYIQVSQFISNLKASIQQISSYAHLWISRVRHAFNAGVIHIFDRHAILQARALKGAHTAPLRRVALGVALGLVGALCLPMGHASSGSIEALDPKNYIRFTMSNKEAVCLMKLYGKESAFNSLAIGNLNGKVQTYGIPQLKNPIIKDKTPIEQINYGVKYINHRYDGDTCKAWKHWIKRGWH